MQDELEKSECRKGTRYSVSRISQAKDSENEKNGYLLDILLRKKGQRYNRSDEYVCACGTFVCIFLWMFDSICIHWGVYMVSSSFEIQEYLFLQHSFDIFNVVTC